MSLGGYLRAHLMGAACAALVVVLLALLLPAMGVGRDAVTLVCVTAALLLAAPGVRGYLRWRPLARELSRLADEGAGALDDAAILEEPGYPEGDLVVRALANVARDGRQQAGAARQDMDEYREYVEGWVHEVKTPLAAARLFLENHDADGLRPLGREVDRTDALVEQALYYARSFSVERDYVIRPASLPDLARAAVRSRAGALIEAHMAVDLQGLEDAALPAALCDAKWMAFILGQLIDNAVRYRCDLVRDGRAPRLAFSGRVEGAGTARERVLLEVGDNGCGIAEADLGRVFERGFTGRNGRTHERSTGMGLYLARVLCEKMGLSISIASQQDVPGPDGRAGWTRVTIAFPTENDHL